MRKALWIAALAVVATTTLAHGGQAATDKKSFPVPKGWPSDAKVKTLDTFKRLSAESKMGVALIFTVSVDNTEKDLIKKGDDFETFVKKIVGDKDTLDLLSSKFVVMAIKVGDRNLGGRNTTVKDFGIVIFGIDGQKVTQIDQPLDSALAFRNVLLQSEAEAAKQRKAREAEKAKEDAERKKLEETAKKQEQEKTSGNIPGLDGEKKTTGAKKPEKKSGALTDE